MTYISIICAITLFYFILEYSLFIPSQKGLCILMYHKVSESCQDDLTVTVSQMDKQFEYIKKNGFHPISFSDLIHNRTLPEKPVIITFDDGYQNNADLALPLLQKYGFPAIFFIATAFIGKTNEWDHGKEPLMNVETLKKLINNGPYEIGVHSHNHINYASSPIEMVEQDVQSSVKTLMGHDIPFLPVIAYPYGKIPKKDKNRISILKDSLGRSGIEFGLRIGSKKNRLPLTDPYEMTRTNIKGSDSFFIFKIKLKKGRAKLFK